MSHNGFPIHKQQQNYLYLQQLPQQPLQSPQAPAATITRHPVTPSPTTTHTHSHQSTSPYDSRSPTSLSNSISPSPTPFIHSPYSYDGSPASLVGEVNSPYSYPGCQNPFPAPLNTSTPTTTTTRQSNIPAVRQPTSINSWFQPPTENDATSHSSPNGRLQTASQSSTITPQNFPNTNGTYSAPTAISMDSITPITAKAHIIAGWNQPTHTTSSSSSASALTNQLPINELSNSLSHMHPPDLRQSNTTNPAQTEPATIITPIITPAFSHPREDLYLNHVALKIISETLKIINFRCKEYLEKICTYSSPNLGPAFSKALEKIRKINKLSRRFPKDEKTLFGNFSKLTASLGILKNTCLQDNLPTYSPEFKQNLPDLADKLASKESEEFNRFKELQEELRILEELTPYPPQENLLIHMRRLLKEIFLTCQKTHTAFFLDEKNIIGRNTDQPYELFIALLKSLNEIFKNNQPIDTKEFINILEKTNINIYNFNFHEIHTQVQLIYQNPMLYLRLDDFLHILHTYVIKFTTYRTYSSTLDENMSLPEILTSILRNDSYLTAISEEIYQKTAAFSGGQKPSLAACLSDIKIKTQQTINLILNAVSNPL